MRSVTRLTPLVKVGVGERAELGAAEAGPARQEPGVRPLVEVGLVGVGRGSRRASRPRTPPLLPSRAVDARRPRLRSSADGGVTLLDERASPKLAPFELSVEQRQTGRARDPAPPTSGVWPASAPLAPVNASCT